MKDKHEPKISLEEYIKKARTFRIPDYQRGYIWGQSCRYGMERKADSVNFMLDTLLSAFEDIPHRDVFIQGITVHKNNKNGILTVIDGQQRTTFFYLLLKWLGCPINFNLHYEIRTKTNAFLKDLDAFRVSSEPLSEKEPYQDIYFMKKSLIVFQSRLKKIDKDAFTRYILSHVKFLYIVIPESKATIVFTLMNGNKAIMKPEELVKSELLRCSSLNSGNIGDAENTGIRSRLAREWDRWMYWWNDDHVADFFHTRDHEGEKRIMGWLLPLSLGSDSVSFDEFRKIKLANTSVKEAKQVFKELRLIQKLIEDVYYNPIAYNYVGTILNIRDSSERRFSFLNWYFKQKREKNTDFCIDELHRYFDWTVIDMNHEDIVSKNTEKLKEAIAAYKEALSSDNLYIIPKEKEIGFRWLLRCNICQDCSQGDNEEGRFFDFSIWRNRSLEHIYPKSKVGHRNELGQLVSQDETPVANKEELKLWREDINYSDETGIHSASEHSIGNLVLLYGFNNSSFGCKDFPEKKNVFFNTSDTQVFKSRHLLHTVSVFAHSEWGGEQIARHKKDMIEEYVSSYKQYLSNE